MKSYNLKILLLLLTLTLASCLPDSTTKFKKDPPKRSSGASSGGVVSEKLLHPINNPYSDDPRRAFFFHYRYTGSATDLATLIITVESSADFSYNSTTPDQNKISNARGTVGTITYIDGNKLYVTLDTNDAYTFVHGDLVDNTELFLSSESNITDIEYTLQVGKTATGTTVFTPQIALLIASDRLDIDVTGKILTPFGKSEFSELFLREAHIGGTISILNDGGAIESLEIMSINLIPGNHSLSVGAGATAFANGIPGDVNRLVYSVPLSTAELGALSYSIDSYLGISTEVANPLSDMNDLVLMGALDSGEVIFKPGNVGTDTNHGNIVIANNISTALKTQSFTVSATDTDGNYSTTVFNFSVAAPPSGLSVARNVLLHVPSGTSYKIGSYVSSNGTDPALGMIKDVLPDINIGGYVYLDVQLIKGKFEEFDDIDNRSKFDSQKTYILGDGVATYNAAVELTGGIANFQDKYSCSTKKYHQFIDSALGSYDDAAAATSQLRGVVSYVWNNSNGPSLLKAAAGHRLYLKVERGALSNNSSIRPSDCSGVFVAAQNISEVIVDNMLLTHGATGALTAGLNITSNDGTNKGSGVIHNSASSTTTYIGQYYHGAEGIFDIAQNIDNENPFLATEDTITAIELDHTFYMYRNEEASVEFYLNEGLAPDGSIPSDTIIEFLEYNGNGYCEQGSQSCTGSADAPACLSHTSRNACEADASFTSLVKGIRWVPTESATPPSGLTFDTTTGRVYGTPTINAEKQKFVLRVTNPYGSTEHNFELKVYDQFVIAPTDTTDSPKPNSYIMHQIGFGMASVPCRITQEAIDTGNADVVDLTCVLDGGESDLFYKGIDLTIRTGDDMCTVVNHTPYYYYDRRPIETSGTARRNTGDITNPLCFTGSPQPALSTDTILAGTYLAEGASPANATLFALATVAEQCLSGNGGGNYSDLSTPGPNCDNGSISMLEVNFTATEFRCFSSSGSASGNNNFNSCYENTGTCAGACTDCPTAGDCASCTNRTSCVSAGSWTFNGSHNQVAAPANADCTADEGVCTSNAGAESPRFGCEVGPPAPQTAVACGGNGGSCISGAGSVGQGLTPDDLNNRARVFHAMTSGTTQVDISYSSPDSQGQSSNFFLANYMKSTSCDASGGDPYAFDWNGWMSYNSNPPGTEHPFAAGGYNYYQYSCDAGAGTIARVRVLVRDFDNSFDITDGIEEIFIPGADTVMDDPAGGTEFCGVFTPCNNRRDLDNAFISNSACGNTDLLFDFNGSGQRFPAQKSQ